MEIDNVVLDMSNNMMRENIKEEKQDNNDESKISQNHHHHHHKKKLPSHGWTEKNSKYIEFCLHRLKYNRIINNFFFFHLKKQEGFYSWMIIIFSAFTSILSLLDNEDEIFTHSKLVIHWLLISCTTIITLIGAWIKKQQFVDRINNTDRYLQQINKTIEEMNVQLILPPYNRDKYEDFCNKYIPLIKNHMSESPVMSPKEWKNTVYKITKYYPELIRGDDTNSERLWPWYDITDSRDKTIFGDLIIDSYKKLNKPKRMLCFKYKGKTDY